MTASARTEGGEKPAAPLNTHQDDSGMKGSGKCSLWGTPYSENPIHFDDIHLTLEVPDAE